MIRIHTPGPSGPAYDNWLAKVKKHRDKAFEDHQAGNEVKLPSDWSDLKGIFLNKAFHEKCAYCEGKHTDGHTPHVEHYRPKKMVTENRIAIKHPGYFWLAYEWWNLLLSCEHCNTYHRVKDAAAPDGAVEEGEEDTDPGKLNEFRIEGPRESPPPDPKGDPLNWHEKLKDEKPLLLNPYFDDPAEHIAFDEHGFPYGLTDRGKETVTVCNLKRIRLWEARKSLEKPFIRSAFFDMYLAVEEDRPFDPPFPPTMPHSAWLNHRMALKVEKMRKALAPVAQVI